MIKNNFFEVNNVDFKAGGITKVKSVSFSIQNEGDIVCLLGPSGIGKTTILRTIAGLEKINGGSIKINGKELSSKKIHIEPEYRNISLAFQENSLFPHYNVEKNILIGAEKKSNKKRKIKPKEIIKFLNLNKISLLFVMGVLAHKGCANFILLIIFSNSSLVVFGTCAYSSPVLGLYNFMKSSELLDIPLESEKFSIIFM